MNNPFIHSDNNKRYLTLAYHNRKIFGGRVYKASLQLGCSCPNRDGKYSTCGCTFCSEDAPKEKAVFQQLINEAARIEKKCGDARIMAYFQTGSNTYCEPDFLYSKCAEVLEYPFVVGLSIGTRADCITDRIADMLYDLSSRTYLTVELGLQTIHDSTAKHINRCHTYNDFLRGYRMLALRGIRICVHLINSLPGESPEMMIESARELGKLSPGGVKIHMLNILKGTKIADQYRFTPFPLLSREEYVNIVVRQLEFIPETTVIERLTGDGAKNKLLSPIWTADKLKTLVEIDKLQALNNSFQGKALL